MKTRITSKTIKTVKSTKQPVKRVIIVLGWDGTPKKDWMAWLKKET